MPGNERLIQTEFSQGMWPSVSNRLIPADGAQLIVNGLLDPEGQIVQRAGAVWSTTATTAPGVTSLRWLWSGYVGATPLVLTGHAGGVDSVVEGAGLTPVIPSFFGIPVRAVSLGGKVYIDGGLTIDSALAFGTAAKSTPYYAVVANRLVAGKDNRIDFSSIGDPATFGATDFHEIPDGAKIVGLEGLRDSLVVFTTAGIWVISNMAYNLTDSDGNVLHRMDRYSRDMVLWGATGIAGFEGGLVIPALDGIYVMSLGIASEAPQAFRLISRPITSLYKSYIASGYTPGGAIVYRGHYLLPIRNGADIVDVLVCKIEDPKAPWTRFFGNDAQIHQFTRNVSTGNLLGASGIAGRVVRCDYFLAPGSTSITDMDGGDIEFFVQTRGYAINGGGFGTVAKVRLDYELFSPAGDATIEATLLEGPQATETALTGSAPENIDSMEARTHAWAVRRNGRFASFQFRSLGAVEHLVIRSVEMLSRVSGRI